MQMFALAGFSCYACSSLESMVCDRVTMHMFGEVISVRRIVVVADTAVIHLQPSFVINRRDVLKGTPGKMCEHGLHYFVRINVLAKRIIFHVQICAVAVESTSTSAPHHP